MSTQYVRTVITALQMLSKSLDWLHQWPTLTLHGHIHNYARSCLPCNPAVILSGVLYSGRGYVEHSPVVPNDFLPILVPHVPGQWALFRAERTLELEPTASLHLDWFEQAM